MITALLVGITAGFVLSIPPGPIAVAVIKQALDGQYRAGFMVATGAMLMDVVYTLLAAFASSAIVSELKDVVLGNEWGLLIFQAVCIVVLVVLGVRYFRATSEDVAETSEQERRSEQRALRIGAGPFFIGITIAITNLASPTFLPSLVALTTYLHSQNLLNGSPEANVLFAVGFGTGAFFWFVVLLRSLYALRRRLPARLVSYIYRFAGGTFIVSAIVLGVNIAVGTDWNSL
jgi:putative LysE/RhtB family amino acid efflux pump